MIIILNPFYCTQNITHDKFVTARLMITFGRQITKNIPFWLSKIVVFTPINHLQRLCEIYI